MAIYETQTEPESESQQITTDSMTLQAMKNIEHIQMCLYATLAATEAAMRMLLSHTPGPS